jgi:AraC-like DNA-binding protein
VARAAFSSTYHFCKVFKETTGLTFTHYLARARVEAAKELLLKPRVRVSEAAYAAGFQSLSQFNRMFLRVTGESPSDFRSQTRRTLAGAASMARPAPVQPASLSVA